MENMDLDSNTAKQDVLNRSKLSCPICKKMFNIKSGLYEHKVVDTGERNHECSICGKQYGLKGNLRHHEAQVHRKEQLYYCRICQKSFSNTTHKLTHTKEKPHKCSE